MPPWNYQEAFSRNLGLISPAEQQKLKNSRVAIAGMGGVGGVHLVTLARLGVGKFTIADPDHFEVANFNRQYGASLPHLNQPKAEVMKKLALEINPQADIKIFNQEINGNNLDQFLDGVDVYLDGVDAFALEARRNIFMEAHHRGIWALTAGPVGFGVAMVIFDPSKMTFDDYFGIKEQITPLDQFAAFGIGLAPRALQRPYMDYAHLDIDTGRAPSSGLACHLSAGTASAQIVKILLGRGKVYSAPYFHQYDPYLNRYVRGYVWGGYKNPIQAVKLFFVKKLFKKLMKKG